MLKIKLSHLLLLSFSMSIISCNAQRKWEKDITLQEKTDREMWLIEKAVDSLSNIFLSDYNDYSLDQNAMRLADSLYSRGMDTLVLYKFGYHGTRNPHRGTYIYANYKGNAINYEIRKDGQYNCNYCTGVYFHFFDIFDSNSFSPYLNKYVYDSKPSNQYYYEDVSLVIKGEIFYSFSLRNETYPDKNVYQILHMIDRGILQCFHLPHNEGWKVRKLSD